MRRALILALVLVVAAILAMGLVAYARQRALGLSVTGLSRDVPWGLYVGQLTFMVGIAASAVMVVLPYYLHRAADFARLIMIAEAVSISALVTCLLFVMADLGMPARVWNVLLHPAPGSFMFWDFVVLVGYLAINSVLFWSALISARSGLAPPRWQRPLAILSIPWAFSIHTVTALLYAGLVARPGWLTAILAPRFLASAFASGPALLLLVAALLRRAASFDVGRAAESKLVTIVIYASIANVFFALLEIFTALYGGSPEQLAHVEHTFRGPLAAASLVAWLPMAGALALLLVPAAREKEIVVALACASIIVAVYADKGFSLVVGGFAPSPFGRMPPYQPTLPELGIVAGVYSVGALLLVFLGRATLTVQARTSKTAPA